MCLRNGILGSPWIWSNTLPGSVESVDGVLGTISTPEGLNCSMTPPLMGMHDTLVCDIGHAMTSMVKPASCFLATTSIIFIYGMCTVISWIWCVPQNLAILFMPLPRLAILLILHGRAQELIAFLAPVCSSYSAVNLGTSKRSLLTPLGQLCNTSVRRGNKMVSRTVFENVYMLKTMCKQLLGK